MKEDIPTATDKGEATSMMEPLLVAGKSKHRGPLDKLALEPVARAARLRGSIPEYVERRFPGTEYPFSSPLRFSANR